MQQAVRDLNFPQVTSEWETPHRPTGKWLMRRLKRPIMSARAHSRETGRRHRDRRNPSGRSALVASWERPAEWPYRVWERWMTQPGLSANTHYRFRHCAVGSPYLYYVNLGGPERPKASWRTLPALLVQLLKTSPEPADLGLGTIHPRDRVTSSFGFLLGTSRLLLVTEQIALCHGVE